MARLWPGVVVALAAPTAAFAAPTYSFNIAPQDLRRALVEATVAANGSLGGDLARCGGWSPGFHGRATLTTALAALLAGSPCSFRVADDNAILIRGPAARSGPKRAGKSEAQSTSTPDITVVASRGMDEDAVHADQRSRVEGEHLNAQGIVTLADLAPQIVGMAATNLGPGRNKVLLRGVSDGVFPGEATATVALYFDDTPLNYVERDPSLRLVDIERVDILRTPQARSPNAIGGAIYIRPARPMLNAFGGSVSTDIQTLSRGGTGYGVNAVLNLPLLEDRDALRLVVYDSRQPGYIKDHLPSGVVTNDGEEVGVRAQNAWVDPSGWRLDSTVIWQRLHVGDSQYVFEPLAGFARNNRVAEPNNNNASYVIQRLQGRLFGAQASWTTSYSDHVVDGRYDATQSLGIFGLSTAIPAVYDAHNHVRSLISSFALKGGWTRATWRAGASVTAERDKGRSLLGLITALDTPLYQDVRQDRRYDISAYVGATFRLIDRVDLDVSLSPYRWRQSVRADAVRADGAVVGKPFTTNVRHEGVEPALALVYRPDGDTTLTARYSAGARPGGVNTGVLLAKRPSGAVPFQANRTYTGDHIDSYELDERRAFFANNLSIKLSEYIMVWKNAQADEFSIYNTPITVNIGDGELRGIEGEALYEPGAGLTLRAFGGAEHAAVGGKLSKAYFSGSYGGLIGAPRYSGGLAVDRRGVTSGIAWRWSATYGRLGPSRATFDGVTASNLRGYSTVNVSADFSIGPWTLNANATNLFDERGDTLAFGNPFSVQRGRQVTPQRPRLITVGLQRRF